MTGLDWIFLTVYAICVISAIFQMISSLFIDRVVVEFEQDYLQKQLAAQNLEGLIGVSFALAKIYQLNDSIRELEISIQNKSDQPLYLEWDYSCFVDPGGRSQRIVRLTPGNSFDLLHPQIFSLIPPGKVLKEKLTAELALKRESETGPLKPVVPLVTFSSLKLDPTKKPPPDAKPPTIIFYFRLVLRLRETVRTDDSKGFYVLNCQLTAKRLPWQTTLPWL